MNGLIRASPGNPHAVVVFSLTIIVLGVLSVLRIPVDILPVFTSPAVLVLTFYGGMPPNEMEKGWCHPLQSIARKQSASLITAVVHV
jgi:multidrug efflux pump subunit AcrB